MKKILKLSTLLIVIILSINIVKAAQDCSDITMTAESNFWTQSGINMNYSTSHNYDVFTLKDKNGRDVPTYCRNAGYTAGKERNGDIFRCTRVVFDPTDNGALTVQKIYDAGVVAILKNGYKANNKNGGTDEYVATTLALRVYEMLYPDLNSNGTNSTELQNAHKYYANLWLDDNEIRTLLTNNYGRIRDKYTSVSNVASWTKGSSNVTNNIVTRAKALLLIGLNAGKEYKENGAASITWNEKPNVSRGAVTTNSDGSKNYEVDATYNFTVNNFNHNGSYLKMAFTCPNCTRYDVDYSIYLNDNNIGKTFPDNLLSYVVDGKLKVAVKFTTASKKYNCEQLEYHLNVNYYDETISNEAYDMFSDKCTSTMNCQHFYLLNRENTVQNIDVDSTISLCNDASVNPNCSALIINSDCSEPGANTEIEIKEGYKLDPATCKQTDDKDKKADILGCVIDGTDASGNSYLYDLQDNPYCSVYCKEDYHFTLPGIKEVGSGRYFSLQAVIKGTKTCYTSAINRGAFESNLLVAAKATADAYTAASKAQAIANINFNNCTTTTETSTLTYTVKEEVTDHDNCTGYEQLSGSSCAAYSTCLDMQMSQGKTKREAVNYCTINTTCQGKCNSWGTKETEVEKTKTCSYSKLTCSYNYQSCRVYDNFSGSCTDVSDNYVISETVTLDDAHECKIPTTLHVLTKNAKNDNGSSSEEAGKELKSKSGEDLTAFTVFTGGGGSPEKTLFPAGSYTAYSGAGGIIGVIGAFNYCGAWDMNYDYNPDMHFWYQESYMKDALSDKLDLIGNTTISNLKSYSCAGSVDSSYDICATGWQENVSYGGKNVFYCDSTGCGNHNISILNASYIKKSKDASGSYITPTQFYTISPSGAIAVAPAGTDIENGSELTNSLPIGLGTPSGKYTYTLITKNLGEYYDSNRLGRIWGNKNSVLAVTLKNSNACLSDGALTYEINVDGTHISNGVYACPYIIDECPDCPTDIACTINNGKYYGIDAYEVSKDNYEEQCTCVVVDGKYRGSTGDIVSEERYKSQCCPDDKCPVDILYGYGFNYRPVSLNKLNPNDRTLGKNWRFNENSIRTGLQLKAYVTTKEIEKNGESIYDIDNNPEFSMKVTMDSRMINKIREYNDDQKTYLNNSLECYDHVSNGKTYKNIYCYSTFIDELLTDNATKKNIKITGNRILNKNERKTKTQASGYWKSWDTASWTVTTEHGIAYYKSNYGEIGIGPSWK